MPLNYEKTDLYMLYENGTMKVGQMIEEAKVEDVSSLCQAINNLQTEEQTGIEKRAYSTLTIS